MTVSLTKLEEGLLSAECAAPKRSRVAGVMAYEAVKASYANNNNINTSEFM